MELTIETGKADDLKLLLNYLGTSANVVVKEVASAGKDDVSPPRILSLITKGESPHGGN